MTLDNRWRERSESQAIGLVDLAAVKKPRAGAVDLYGNPSWGDLNRVGEIAGAIIDHIWAGEVFTMHG